MLKREALQHGSRALLASVYALVLAGILLMPFDFALPLPFTWLEGVPGVGFSSVGGLVQSSASALRRFHAELLTGTGLTVELVAATKRHFQPKVSRIVSYSGGLGSSRNFTLAQSGSDLLVRLRTSRGLVGPRVENLFTHEGPRSVAVTYDFSDVRVYVDGQMYAQEPAHGNMFRDWDPSFSFLLGNEVTGNRPWVGQLFYLAIYSRPLSEHEIFNHRVADGTLHSRADSVQARPPEDLVALYRFDEGRGDRVHDRSGKLPPLHLSPPKGKQAPVTRQFLASPFSPPRHSSPGEVALGLIGNVVLFVPFGYFCALTLRKRSGRARGRALFVCLLTALFTLSVESLQYFSLTRVSSTSDAICNLAGGAMGVLLLESGLVGRAYRAVVTSAKVYQPPSD